MKKTILLLTSLILLCCGSTYQALAARTQANEVTDLFDKHLEDKEALLQNMQKQNDNATEQIKSRKHHEAIEGIDGAEGKAAELNSIKETDLDSAGRERRASGEYQFYDENALEPDYTKPGNIMHKLDAEDITKATDSKMREIGTDFMKSLAKQGFNCKTVKGAIHKEPTYHIEIKREEQKNSEYDQLLCEEPRNQYNCRNTLSLTCSKRVMNWNLQQNRSTTMLYQEIPSHWWRAESRIFSLLYQGRWEHTAPQYCRMINPAYHPEIARHIANAIGVTVEQIHIPNQDILLTAFPNRSTNVDLSNCHKEDRFGVCLDPTNAKITFQYREGHEVCEKWSENWTERCLLK